MSQEDNGGSVTIDGSTKLSAIKEEIAWLSTQKNAIEAEATAIWDELNCPPESDSNLPPIGLRNSLIDEEGYPKAGYDLMRIRSRRQRFHCLQTDHTDVVKRIEAQRAETSAKSVRPSSTLQSSPSHLSSTPLTNRAEERHDDSDAAPATSVYGDEWLPHAVAFARVDEVGYDSPAAAGGLQEGDLIISFGRVNAFDWQEGHESISTRDQFPLSVVQTELRRAVLNRSGSEFKQGIEVRVLRGSSSQPSLLRITPEMREGQGHLGCCIVPLKIRTKVDGNNS